MARNIDLMNHNFELVDTLGRRSISNHNKNMLPDLKTALEKIVAMSKIEARELGDIREKEKELKLRRSSGGGMGVSVSVNTGHGIDRKSVV